MTKFLTYQLIYIISSPHLWSWALGSDRKNEVEDMNSQKGFFRSPERIQMRWMKHLIRIPHVLIKATTTMEETPG